MSLAVLAEIAVIGAYGWVKPETAAGTLGANNVEQIGWALYTDFLIPFESRRCCCWSR